MHAPRTLTLGLATLALALTAALAVTDAYTDARRAYFGGDLPQARFLFAQLVADSPGDPTALAWLAETCRRLGDYPASLAHARHALALDPHHAMAHTTLADASNPMFSNHPLANADTTWAHLLQAVAADSSHGVAWMGIWTEAIRRQDPQLERTALRRLYRSGFITPCAQAYARWLLEALPPSALLVVNGDQDTYPVLALQQEADVRPDVVVVNRSLLNLDWYQRHVAERGALPLPGDERGQPLAYRRHGQEEQGSSSDRVLRSWVHRSEAGSLGRPLVFSITIGDFDGYLPDRGRRLVLRGPYFHLSTAFVDDTVDEDAIMASLESVDPEDFAGPFAARTDTSPIRVSGGQPLIRNVMAAAFRAASDLAAAGRGREAREAIAWIDEFGSHASSGPMTGESFNELKEILSGSDPSAAAAER